MTLVDSSVWIDYFNGRINRQTDLLDRFLETEPVLTGDLILAEVLQGFREEKHFLSARELLLTLPYMDMLGRSTALQAAENFRLLRKKGITIRKTIDVQIATFCVSNGITLLHNDADFDIMTEHLGLEIR
jgi:predicted nucleic acid-binding protein